MSIPLILQKVQELGYVIFTNGDYNLNIIGVRSPSRIAGKFDDHLYAVYKVNGEWVEKKWNITTDPGTYYLDNPLNVEGTAIMLPGQYRGAYIIGKHKGYDALVQYKPIKFVRDNNKDHILDIEDLIKHGKVIEAVISANIHCSDTNPFDSADFIRTDIGKWSAACQVFQSSVDYREWWEIVKHAEQKWGNKFTYTLING